MWQNEWPTEPGLYFFYGWMWDKEPGKREPQWSIVSVEELPREGLSYICNGSFMYKSENHTGKWLKVLVPSEPDLMDLLLERKKNETTQAS